MSRRLITDEEAVEATCQHVKACSDCPWSRKSLNGWLGGNTAEEWVSFAHSDVVIPCHVLKGAQCAGAAIYRRNVAKWVDAPNLRLEKDKVAVFANPMEFMQHHVQTTAKRRSRG